MDGGSCLSIDEFRFYLKNAQFAAVVDNLLLTVRKSNGAVFLALQMPEHILESPLGPSIVAQCQTKIMYPSPTADRDVYIRWPEMHRGRVPRRPRGHADWQAALPAEAGARAASSANSILATCANISRCSRVGPIPFGSPKNSGEQFGDEPGRWLSEFMQRYHEATD